MTLREIINQLPEKGRPNGTPEVGDIEDRMDHMLENLAFRYSTDSDQYQSGMAYAAHIMAIAMTLDGVDWEIIRNTLNALADHLPN